MLEIEVGVSSLAAGAFINEIISLAGEPSVWFVTDIYSLCHKLKLVARALGFLRFSEW